VIRWQRCKESNGWRGGGGQGWRSVSSSPRAQAGPAWFFLTWLPLLVLLARLLGPPAEGKEERVLAIQAGRIETITEGRIDDGVIVIRNGKIEAVGKEVKVPAEAELLDASGQTVMPGLVNPFTGLGRSSGGGGLTPHYRVYDELYPFQEVYRQVLRAGTTTLALVPDGTGIPGQGAVIKPQADSAEEMALVPEALLMIGFEANTTTQEQIRNALVEGRKELENRRKQVGEALQKLAQPRSESQESSALKLPVLPTLPAPSPQQAPLLAALQGELPVFVSCGNAAAILHWLDLLEKAEVKLPGLVLVVNPDVWRVADRLAACKIPVILRIDVDTQPYTRNRINVPRMLAEAGVKFACRPTQDSVAGHENWLFKMAESVKNGLSRDLALKAITLHPAEFLHIADRVGSIGPGKEGNLLILSGDPLDPLTRIQGVILEGQVVYRESAGSP
jgi:hypothetical protein